MAKSKTANNKKKPAKPAKQPPTKKAAKPSAGRAPAGKPAPPSASKAGASKAAGSKAPAAPLPPLPPLNPKRKLGLRGAAPWAARHAAKHAAEARARAAEPAPPGSARATIRTPTGAQTQKIRTLRKRLEKGFYEIGQVLTDIQVRELFQAKGYGSFEAFVEREIDLGKMTCMKLMKVPTIFQKEAALDFGMDRVFSAISALEGELIPKAIPSAPGSKPGLPLKPPSRLVG
jgi:hypothetical protein